MYAQALEAAGFGVDRLMAIGTREVRNEAFTSGQVDLVPEYVGSGLGFWVLGADDPQLAAIQATGDGETNREGLQRALDIAGVDATVLAITAARIPTRPSSAATPPTSWASATWVTWRRWTTS